MLPWKWKSQGAPVSHHCFLDEQPSTRPQSQLLLPVGPQAPSESLPQPPSCQAVQLPVCPGSSPSGPWGLPSCGQGCAAPQLHRGGLTRPHLPDSPWASFLPQPAPAGLVATCSRCWAGGTVVPSPPSRQSAALPNRLGCFRHTHHQLCRGLPARPAPPPPEGAG